MQLLPPAEKEDLLHLIGVEQNSCNATTDDQSLDTQRKIDQLS